MREYLGILAVVLLASTVVKAQEPVWIKFSGKTAPIKWEMYADPDFGFSASFPKLPLRIEKSNPCDRTDGVSYYAYAGEVVYKVEVQRKASKAAPSQCRVKSVFDSTMAFAQVVQANNVQIERLADGTEIARLLKGDVDSWFMNDVVTNRLFELSVYHREGVIVDADKFRDSLNRKRDPASKPIGIGSEEIVGDAVPETPEPAVTAEPRKPTDWPYRVVLQPKATYTNQARKRGVQGSVVVGIKLNGDGSVGSIRLIKGLSDGLTEEAVNAARKMVFIPRKAKGINVPIIVIREYAFRIY